VSVVNKPKILLRPSSARAGIVYRRGPRTGKPAQNRRNLAISQRRGAGWRGNQAGTRPV